VRKERWTRKGGNMNDVAYKATKSKICDAKDKCDDIKAKSL